MAPGQLRRVFGYGRVSSKEQEESGLGLAAQRAAIMAEARRRGWKVVRFYEDAGVQAKKIKKQTQLQAALAELAKRKHRQADGLVVMRLDRLTRSLVGFASTLDDSISQGWALVTLDNKIDASTASGRANVRMLAVFAQLESELISERTCEAAAAKRSKGEAWGFAPVPSKVTAYVLKRYGLLGDAWGVQSGIARELDKKASKDRTWSAPSGHHWRQSTVRGIIERHRQQTQAS